MRLKSLAIVMAMLPQVAPCIVNTAQRLRQLPPALVAKSSRSIPEISGCLQQVADKRGWPINYMPRAGGATFTSFDIAPILIVDAEDLGATRHLTFYWQPNRGKSSGAELTESLNACL